MKASKRYYESNSIQFKQEGSVVYSVRLTFERFSFFFFFLQPFYPTLTEVED